MDKGIQARFRSKTDVRDDNECWPWKPLGSVHGYGQFTFQGTTRLAHRVAYELAYGPIPDGLTIDHLCRVRNCVNPAHLEAVTRAENLRRAKSWENGAAFQREKTHCPYGHPYSGENLRVARDGKRACRACSRRHTAEHRSRKRAENPPTPRAKKSACKNGHLYAEHGFMSGGKQRCRICTRENLRAYRARTKAAADPVPVRTHCRHGHEWNEENTYVSPGGQTACRACHRNKSREWHRARAAAKRALAVAA